MSISRILFMRAVESTMASFWAMAPPLKPVPAPRGTTGILFSLAKRITREICSAFRPNTTAPGRLFSVPPSYSYSLRSSGRSRTASLPAIFFNWRRIDEFMAALRLHINDIRRGPQGGGNTAWLARGDDHVVIRRNRQRFQNGLTSHRLHRGQVDEEIVEMWFSAIALGGIRKVHIFAGEVPGQRRRYRDCMLVGRRSHCSRNWIIKDDPQPALIFAGKLSDFQCPGLGGGLPVHKAGRI